ncbi:unnamed protein product [Schistosoma mattheei]|uniref:Uncharacterized protein n=1 Tax=Schistosoma mattheei TaxID=31246 RepID=A0A183Q678_9TREM|nr:unnamed protein product [Schistosoma mattheei]
MLLEETGVLLIVVTWERSCSTRGTTFRSSLELLSAICCTDDIHCCPSGTSCDYKTLSCVKTDNGHSIGSPTANELLRNPGLLFTGVRDHVCPGHQSTCADDQTCCPLPDKSFGCCPLKNVRVVYMYMHINFKWSLNIHSLYNSL